MVILGAGLSGLICGALNAQSVIYERNGSEVVSHKAVLRFRDDKIARALGLTFRKVTVRKAIWFDGREVPPSPRLANFYGLKVRGVVTDNSLWNVGPSERFIAPDDLHAVLATICGPRVRWNSCVMEEDIGELLSSSLALISTIPLPVLLKLLAVEHDLSFLHYPIHVNRYWIRDCDVFQTIYFPHPQEYVYRATLTGELLTIEAVEEIGEKEYNGVMDAFGIPSFCGSPHSVNHRQSFGKIVPIPDGPRKAILHKLTSEWRIYSLGRFATWKNILLDDVYEDIAAIRRMMTMSQYDHTLERTK